MNTRARQRGLTLIELMVAMTIGLVLMAGAALVYSNSRKSYATSETVARLQETARYAFSVLEPDVRLANYWGLLKGGDGISGATSQSLPPGAAAPSLAANACGNNFAIDLGRGLQADNDGYVLSATRTAACDLLADISTGLAWTTTPVTTADTLVVRRASGQAALPVAGQLQVCTSRSSGQLKSDGTPCASPAPTTLLANVLVHAYYVDQNSTQQAGLPSLRRKVLTGGLAGIAFRDQEVAAGIEDMQLQFGIDPAGNTGSAQVYVDPGALPAGAQVVAVRIWLLVRADAGETGYTDNTVYEYGNRLAANGVTGNLDAAASAGLAYQPSLSPDASPLGERHARHLLVSRTIQVRNVYGN